MSGPSPADAPLPLTGLRVIDLATLIAGPTAARWLGDYGAEVIKVERPGAGDPVRAMHAHAGDVSLWWKNLSRNKRPIAVDLKDARGIALLKRLLADADVLVENFRPGTLERLGLDPVELCAEFPRLVVLRVSGFGQTGPEANRPGFGTLAEAFSGYAGLTGYDDRPPLLPPIALADELTGLFGAFAVMAALRHRDVSGGRGQIVDAALYESVFALLGPLPSLFAANGYLQPRLGSRIGYTAPRNAYRCADGRWVALSGSSQATTAKILEAVEAGELFDDPRFATAEARLANIDALDTVIADWIGAHPRNEVMQRFLTVGAPIADCHDMAGVFADAHYAARGTIARVADAELGEVAMPNVVPRLSATPGRIRFAGAPYASATREVLAECGYSPDEIDALVADGVVDAADTPPPMPQEQ